MWKIRPAYKTSQIAKFRFIVFAVIEGIYYELICLKSRAAMTRFTAKRCSSCRADHCIVCPQFGLTRRWPNPGQRWNELTLYIHKLYIVYISSVLNDCLVTNKQIYISKVGLFSVSVAFVQTGLLHMLDIGPTVILIISFL